MSSKMASTFCLKWFLKTRFFVKKTQNFVQLELYYLVQISLACSTSIFKGMYKLWRDFRRSTSVLATVAVKNFNDKFTEKIDFPIRYFMLPLLMMTLKVYSLPIHYLTSIWTTFW